MIKTDPAQHGGGRRKPYTWAGVRRLLCSVAGGDPDAEVKIAAYRAEVEADIGRPLER